MKLTSKASIQIQKSIEEVYEGIVNPSSMTQYFISESTGSLENGQNVFWKFPEFDDQFEISKVKVNANRSISFVWDPATIVNINLEAKDDNSTVVHVTEGAKELKRREYPMAHQQFSRLVQFLGLHEGIFGVWHPSSKGGI